MKKKVISAILAAALLSSTALGFDSVTRDFNAAQEDGYYVNDVKPDGDTKWKEQFDAGEVRGNVVANPLGKTDGNAVMYRAFANTPRQLIVKYDKDENGQDINAIEKGSEATFGVNVYIPESANVDYVVEFETTTTFENGSSAVKSNKAVFKRGSGDFHYLKVSGYKANNTVSDGSRTPYNYYEPNQWYYVSAKVQNNTITFYLDGREMFSYTTSAGENDYISKIQLCLGFEGTPATADEPAYMVFDDASLLNNSPEENIQLQALDTTLSAQEGAGITVRSTSYDQKTPFVSQIDGAAEGMSVKALKEQLKGPEGGSIRAAKFNQAMTEEMKDPDADMLQVFATQELSDDDFVDQDTKIISISKGGACKIYSMGEMETLPGDNANVSQVNVYTLEQDNGKIRYIPYYTPVSYFLSNVFLEDPRATKEVFSSGEPFTGVMMEDGSYTLQVTSYDKTVTKSYAIELLKDNIYETSWSGYKGEGVLYEAQDGSVEKDEVEAAFNEITPPSAGSASISGADDENPEGLVFSSENGTLSAISGGKRIVTTVEEIVSEFVVRPIEAGQFDYLLKIKQQDGSYTLLPVLTIKDGAVFIGEAAVAHCAQGQNNIKLAITAPKTPNPGKITLRKVWINGVDAAENVEFPVSELGYLSKGVGLYGYGFAVQGCYSVGTLKVKGYGPGGFDIGDSDTTIESESYTVDFYKAGDVRPTLRGSFTTVGDLKENLTLPQGASMTVYSAQSSNVLDDQEAVVDGVKVEIVSKDAEAKVTYYTKNAPFSDGTRAVETLQEITGDRLIYTGSGSAIVAVYEDQVLSGLKIAESGQCELDLSGIDIATASVKAFRWESLESARPLAEADRLEY